MNMQACHRSGRVKGSEAYIVTVAAVYLSLSVYRCYIGRLTKDYSTPCDTRYVKFALMERSLEDRRRVRWNAVEREQARSSQKLRSWEQGDCDTGIIGKVDIHRSWDPRCVRPRHLELREKVEKKLLRASQGQKTP